jgi:transcriptional regulator with XRE-family HTH domain
MSEHNRLCARCRMPLAVDHRETRCAGCLRALATLRQGPPQVSPTFWDSPDIRQAIREMHMGKVLAAYRHHHEHGRHIPQETAGEWAGMSQAQISRFERGSPELRIDRLAFWARLLGMPDTLWWFSTATGGASSQPSTVTAHAAALQAQVAGSVQPLEEADARELLGAVASITVGSIPRDISRWLPDQQPGAFARELSDAEIETVLKTTELHRRLDAATGGGSCLQSAVGYARWASQLLHMKSPSEASTQRLQTALADLHNLIGWSAHDLDQNGIARQHLVQSLILARSANALPLLANTLYRLGRISLQQDRPDEGLHLFNLALPVAQQARCHASVAILHANQAWAFAQLGDADLVVDSLTRASAERARANLDTTPAWAKFALTEADANGIAAVVYTELARHPDTRRFAGRAVEHAHRALELRAATSERRSFIFDVISVATASTLDGDLATAGAYGATAVDLVEEGMASARVLDRLAAYWELVAPSAAKHPELEQVGARLDHLTRMR